MSYIDHPRTVLVAGASGRLGRHVVRECKRAGYRVRALLRDPRAVRVLGQAADEIELGDLTDPATIAGVCAGVDVVISCAGASTAPDRPLDRSSFRRVDLGGNRTLLREARGAGVGRFLYVSLLGGPALRDTEYAGSHEAFADELAASGLAYTVVRPAPFFSAFEPLLAAAARGRLPVVGDGSARVNPIDVRELAARCVAAAEGGPRELHVGGPQVLTRLAIAELAAESLGVAARPLTLSPRALRAAAAGLRALNPRVAALAEFSAAASARDLIGRATGVRTIGAYFTRLALPRRITEPVAAPGRAA